MTSCCTKNDVVSSDTLNFYRISMANHDGIFFDFKVWKTKQNIIQSSLYGVESDLKKEHCNINISEKDWMLIESVFKSCSFWKMSPYARPYALEGNAYHIEACHNGMRHKVWRVNPEYAKAENGFMKIASLMINMALEKQGHVIVAENNR